MQNETKGDVQLDFRNPVQHTDFATPGPKAELNGREMMWNRPPLPLVRKTEFKTYAGCNVSLQVFMLMFMPVSMNVSTIMNMFMLMDERVSECSIRGRAD